jgi:hypothetical protein
MTNIAVLIGAIVFFGNLIYIFAIADKPLPVNIVLFLLALPLLCLPKEYSVNARRISGWLLLITSALSFIILPIEVMYIAVIIYIAGVMLAQLRWGPPA